LKFPALDQVKMARIISFLTLAISILCAVEATCPPYKFESKPGGINPTKFFAGRWYSLKQLPSSFQPENEFYCANINYTLRLKSFCKMAYCNRNRIHMRTTSRNESINGKLNVKNTLGLIESSARLSLVRPSFPLSYWVVETGSYRDLLSGNLTYGCDQYDWAIVSSGIPEMETQNGCLPPVTHGSGLWLYSRQPTVTEEIMSRLEAMAASKGFDVSALKSVVQEGCSYDLY
jgi:lipocalin